VSLTLSHDALHQQCLKAITGDCLMRTPAAVFVLLLCPVRLLAELQVFELQHATPRRCYRPQPLLGPTSRSRSIAIVVVSADAGAMSRISELLADSTHRSATS
jgi:hypothetical protein